MCADTTDTMAHTLLNLAVPFTVAGPGLQENDEAPMHSEGDLHKSISNIVPRFSIQSFSNLHCL